jgi:uncharacterized protein (TIGR03086 family)
MAVPGEFSLALDEFGRRVRAVPDDVWHDPTPCADWDVRALVNHVVGELRWIPPLLAGRTVADVGSALDGDLLGDDAIASWQAASDEARAAARAVEGADPTVHLSSGDATASTYLAEVTADVVVHTWDLARGAHGDDRLDPALVAFAEDTLGPQVESWRAAGAFGPAADVPPEADAQQRLLAATGRTGGSST